MQFCSLAGLDGVSKVNRLRGPDVLYQVCVDLRRAGEYRQRDFADRRGERSLVWGETCRWVVVYL